MKRVNFNMHPECHALLKGVCALKRITVSDYVNQVLFDAFVKLVKEDNQMKTLFFSGTYPEGSPAYLLKESLIEELNQSNGDTD